MELKYKNENVANAAWLCKQADEVRALFNLKDSDIALNYTRGMAALKQIISTAQELQSGLNKVCGKGEEVSK